MQGLRVPADIFALKSIGIDAWRSRVFWPVSDAEYSELANLVLDEFDRVLVRLDPGDSNLLLCDSTFAAFLIKHFHALLVQARIRQMGAELMIGRVQQAYRPDWEVLQVPLVLERRSSVRWKMRLREFVKGVAFSSSRPVTERLKSAFGTSDYVCVGSYGKLLERYLAEKTQSSCAYMYPQSFIGESDVSPMPSPNSKMEDAVRMLLENLNGEIRERFDLEFDVFGAASCWVRRIEFLRGVEHAIRAKARMPRQLFCTEPASSMHKLLSKVVLEAGGRVTAFAHGNDPGLLMNRMTGYVQMSLCSEFVCPSARSTELYRDVLSLTSIGQLHEVEYVSLSENQFQDWHLQFGREGNATPPKSVMVIGYPMNPTRYVLSQGDFFLFQLDLELQILRCLRRMGLRTIYKMHPDRIDEARGLFETECDEVMVSPFETVWSAADAFVFPCTTSTTFGFALCTPRPIVVVDVPGLKWNPRVYPGLSRRCRMVPASITPENRLLLDQVALIAALGPDADRWDDRFVSEFMYPQVRQQVTQ